MPEREVDEDMNEILQGMVQAIEMEEMEEMEEANALDVAERERDRNAVELPAFPENEPMPEIQPDVAHDERRDFFAHIADDAMEMGNIWEQFHGGYFPEPAFERAHVQDFGGIPAIPAFFQNIEMQPEAARGQQVEMIINFGDMDRILETLRDAQEHGNQVPDLLRFVQGPPLIRIHGEVVDENRRGHLVRELAPFIDYLMAIYR